MDIDIRKLMRNTGSDKIALCGEYTVKAAGNSFSLGGGKFCDNVKPASLALGL